MEQILNNILPIALAAVAVVLVLGLRTLLKGGSPNASQNLMRWRIGLQFIAIVIVMAAIYFGGRTP
ncbi:MAG: twin transmembrane helix small protein [Hyphomicrobiales bacterium]|nr:twin transmembrane helix small protein [Hyphomicrobiales bacterium]